MVEKCHPQDGESVSGRPHERMDAGSIFRTGYFEGGFSGSLPPRAWS